MLLLEVMVKLISSCRWLIGLRIGNSHLPFRLTPQTASALIVTLRAQALLIDELLEEGYLFVLTGAFNKAIRSREGSPNIDK